MNEHHALTVSETRALWDAEATHERVLISAQLIFASRAGTDCDLDPARAAAAAVEGALALEAQFLTLPKDARLLRVIEERVPKCDRGQSNR